MKETNMVVGLRLGPDVLKRADALIPRLRKTDLSVGRISRNMVLRLAINRGLDALEKEPR